MVGGGLGAEMGKETGRWGEEEKREGMGYLIEVGEYSWHISLLSLSDSPDLRFL